MALEGSSIGFLEIVGAKYTISSSVFSVINSGAGNVILRSSRPITITPPTVGVTAGSITLKPGDAFNWNNFSTGVQNIEIDATASTASVAFN